MSLSALTSGIRIDKKKNATALAFQQQTLEPAAPGPLAFSSSLDFFGSTTAAAPESSSSSKKRKRGDTEAKVTLASAQESEQIRRERKIKVQGETSNLCTGFDQLALPPELLRSLANNSWTEPTSIQMQAIPLILQQRDLLACASTGSGKTLAFLLPLLMRHIQKPWFPQQLRAVIIEPTRELARQVYAQAIKLSQDLEWRVCLLGESDLSSETPPDIIIATPQRFAAAIRDKSISAGAVETLCFDEADKLFELDFLRQSDSILMACSNPQLRKAMFSATVPSGFEEMVRRIVGADLVRVIVGHKDGNTHIAQQLQFCATEEGKLATLKDLITNGQFLPPALIFVQSVERAKELEKQLKQTGVHVGVIHSDLTKTQRARAVAAFAVGEIWCLVSTEVMARGVDFKAVNMVINYDLPTSPTEYLHRIGRTGRNGRAGKAVTFFTSDDATLVRPIVNVMRNSGVDVPEWLANIKSVSKKERQKLKRRPVQRKSISEAASEGYAAPPPGTQKRKRKQGSKGSVQRALADIEDDEMHDEDA